MKNKSIAFTNCACAMEPLQNDGTGNKLSFSDC